MRKTALTFFTFLTMFCMSWAQQGTSSPYSRYAFGELNSGSFSAYAGWGSANIAMADSFLLNVVNPASFANIMPHRPVFDIGVGGQLMEIRSSESAERTNTVGLRNIALGFPINKRSGFAFGLMPFSSVGYSMSSIVTESGIGDVTYSFSGKGGLNRLFLGYGAKLINNADNMLSIGAKGSYLFGNILRERKAVYPTYTGILNAKVRHNTIVSDFIFDFGIHYRYRLVNSKGSRQWINAGLSYSLPSEVSARQEMLSYTYKTTFTENLIDTVEYIDTTKGIMNFPQKIGAGISYEINKTHSSGGAFTRYVFNLQFETQDWARYAEVFGENRVEDQLRNSNSLAFGFQVTPYASPDINLEKAKIWDLTNYRLGFRYSNTYLQINDTQLKQYGISFGFGIPLLYSSSLSMINLGVEIGKRGTTENSLLEENFINFHVGFSISPGSYEGWFYKRKYD